MKILLVVTGSIETERFFSQWLGKKCHFVFRNPIRFVQEDVKNFAVDLLIIDEQSLSKEVFGFIETLRSNKESKLVPILVLTPKLKIAHTKKLLAAGASDILCKPLDPEETEARIEIVFQNSATSRKMKSLKLPETITPQKAISKRIVFSPKVRKLVEAHQGASLMMIHFITQTQAQAQTQPHDDKLINTLQFYLGPEVEIILIQKGAYLIIKDPAFEQLIDKGIDRLHTYLQAKPHRPDMQITQIQNTHHSSAKELLDALAKKIATPNP